MWIPNRRILKWNKVRPGFDKFPEIYHIQKFTKSMLDAYFYMIVVS